MTRTWICSTQRPPSEGGAVAGGCGRRLHPAPYLPPTSANAHSSAAHGSCRGGDPAAFRESLLAADAKYETWGFGGEEPRGAALAEALFAREPIEWNRIGVFQDITMRLVAQRLLPEGHTPLQGLGEHAPADSDEDGDDDDKTLGTAARDMAAQALRRRLAP